MNAHKLTELKERAENAMRIANEIQSIQKHSRLGNYLRFTGTRDSYSNLIDDELLAEIFDIGKAQLIARKESELSKLLGDDDKPAVVQADPPGDFYTGTLDSSDTWEPPMLPLETQVLSN